MSGKLRSEDLRVISSDRPEAESAAQSVAPRPKKIGIEIQDATLQYPIGPYVRGSLKSSLLHMFGRKDGQPRYVDAIINLSLSVNEGERVGIIGSNGSGKSTLLRSMAGVYPLKGGKITVSGQIGTLLDIGLGFESESTGRENIYYRGMSMGYSRKELAAAEQEIVEFAGLGEFIDLPMRTYSSGMYVRLGFAVSTQFKPDVLLIDEVFGAGDAAFAEKAFQRMTRIVESAGIMMLATHDVGLVQRLCTRAIWLNRGRIVQDGPPVDVIRHFQNFMAGASAN